MTTETDNMEPRVLASFRSTDLVTISRRQQVFGGVVLNVLVNVVVLNLYVEFADEVVIDSFTISVFTALLLTVMLGVIVRFEHRVRHFFFDQHDWRIAGVIAIWLVLFGSKFLILEIVDIVFGDHVELGHLLEVILIVVTMMAAGQLVQLAYDRLGPETDEKSESSTRGAG